MPDQTAKTIADMIYQGVLCRYGVPEGLHADQGRNFEAQLMKELVNDLVSDVPVVLHLILKAMVKPKEQTAL